MAHVPEERVAIRPHQTSSAAIRPHQPVAHVRIACGDVMVDAARLPRRRVHHPPILLWVETHLRRRGEHMHARQVIRWQSCLARVETHLRRRGEHMHARQVIRWQSCLARVETHLRGSKLRRHQ